MRFEPTPESELLYECARWAVDSELAGPIAQLAERITEVNRWQEFFELADAHGLAAIAADCFHCSEVKAPPGITIALNAALRENSKRWLVLGHELERLLKCFDAASIPVITLKGPAMAHAIYRDPAHRFSGDLDLLIHPDDFVRAAELLNLEGYREPGDARLVKARRAFRGWNYEAVFEREKSRISVDLHWDVMPPGFPVKFSIPAVWGRSAAGRLHPEDELAFLCAHAAKHDDPGLSRVVDICLLLKNNPAPSAQIQTGGIVRFALRNAALLMGGGGSGLTEMPRLGIAYTIRLAITPTEADWESWPGLPRGLFFLYFPWRWIRLARKHIFSSALFSSTPTGSPLPRSSP